MYNIHSCQKVINRVRCKMYLHCHPCGKMHLHCHSCASLSRATLVYLCITVRDRYNDYANSTPCGKIAFVGKYLSKWNEIVTYSRSIPCRRDLLISSMSLISVMICIFVIWQSYPTIHTDELSSSRRQSMLMQYECYQVFIWQGNQAIVAIALVIRTYMTVFGNLVYGMLSNWNDKKWVIVSLAKEAFKTGIMESSHLLNDPALT